MATLLPPFRILLAGGSGHIGSALLRHFLDSGHRVSLLTRQPRLPADPRIHVFQWDGLNLASWADELDSADVLINLSGRSVDCRYTPANKAAILASRVQSTTVLGQAIARSRRPPRLWLNASTATIYPHSLDRTFDESSPEAATPAAAEPPSWAFSYEVARRWEDAFFSAPAPSTRKVALRSAMVMSPDRGGIFDSFLRVVRFGLGGPMGDGRQSLSWIHESDFAAALDLLIARDDLEGPIVLSSPTPIPNAEFLRILRDVWGIRFGLASPPWMLRIGALALRTETELLLKSRRVAPTRLLHAGFHFQFADWRRAALELVERWRGTAAPTLGANPAVYRSGGAS